MVRVRALGRRRLKYPKHIDDIDDQGSWLRVAGDGGGGVNNNNKSAGSIIAVAAIATGAADAIEEEADAAAAGGAAAAVGNGEGAGSDEEAAVVDGALSSDNNIESQAHRADSPTRASPRTSPHASPRGSPRGSPRDSGGGGSPRRPLSRADSRLRLSASLQGMLGEAPRDPDDPEQ